MDHLELESESTNNQSAISKPSATNNTTVEQELTNQEDIMAVDNNNQPAISKSVEAVEPVKNNPEHKLTFASQEDTMAVDDIMCSSPKKRS